MNEPKHPKCITHVDENCSLIRYPLPDEDTR